MAYTRECLFADLLDQSERELKAEITKLVDAKRRGDELDRGPRIEPISRFVEPELQRLEGVGIARCEVRKVPDEKLDTVFRSLSGSILNSNWF